MNTLRTLIVPMGETTKYEGYAKLHECTFIKEVNGIQEPVIQTEHISPIQKTMHVAEFWDRLTEDEQEKLLTATSVKAKRLLFELSIKSILNVENQRFINMLNAMETENIITPGRSNEILR